MADNTNTNGKREKNLDSQYTIPEDLAKLEDFELAMEIVRMNHKYGIGTEVDTAEPREELDVDDVLSRLDTMSMADIKASFLKVAHSRGAASDKPLRLKQAEWAFKNRIWKSLPLKHSPKEIKAQTDETKRNEWKAENEAVESNRKKVTQKFFEIAEKFVSEEEAAAEAASTKK